MSGAKAVRRVLRSIVVLASLGASTSLAQECNDGIDNNNDGLVDMDDLYCKAPTDNDESSFGSGPGADGTNLPRNLDCWFDADMGSGNDDCSIHACCMIDGPCPAELEPELFDPGACNPSATCLDICIPLTRVGCDCFGCCAIRVPESPSAFTVFVNRTASPNCTLDTLGDPSLCRPCRPHPSCWVPWPPIFQDDFESGGPDSWSRRRPPASEP
jgi:hypothetical protein